METERLPDIDNKNISKKSKAKDTKKADDKKKAKNRSKFAKEVIAELKKVSWPSKKDVIKATGVVVAISAALGIVVGLFDYLFSTLIGLIVG